MMISSSLCRHERTEPSYSHAGSFLLHEHRRRKSWGSYCPRERERAERQQPAFLGWESGEGRAFYFQLSYGTHLPFLPSEKGHWISDPMEHSYPCYFWRTVIESIILQNTATLVTLGKLSLNQWSYGIQLPLLPLENHRCILHLLS